MILSYEEYLNMGGVLKETAFDLYNIRAQNQIYLRAGRKIESTSPNLKLCVFQLIGILEESDLQEKNPTTFNNDGVSVSFAKRSDSETKEKINQIILEYLNEETDSEGIPLLYRGVNV